MKHSQQQKQYRLPSSVLVLFWKTHSATTTNAAKRDATVASRFTSESDTSVWYYIETLQYYFDYDNDKTSKQLASFEIYLHFN